MASTFDPDLIHQVGVFLAEETKVKSSVILLAPTCNIQRNPLGGRAFESFSEDPHLSGVPAFCTAIAKFHADAAIWNRNNGCGICEWTAVPERRIYHQAFRGQRSGTRTNSSRLCHVRPCPSRGVPLPVRTDSSLSHLDHESFNASLFDSFMLAQKSAKPWSFMTS